MGWIADLRGERIGLDTAPLIYYIEKNPVYYSVIHSFFEALNGREFVVVTSTITLLEVLVHPIRQKNYALAGEYKRILTQAEGVDIYALNTEIAESAAKIRSEYNVKTPDAIQMATAIQAGAKYFLTNDIALPELPNLRMLYVEKLKTE